MITPRRYAPLVCHKWPSSKTPKKSEGCRHYLDVFACHTFMLAVHQDAKTDVKLFIIADGDRL